MSEAKPDFSHSSAFINDTLDAVLSGMERISPESFTARLLEKMIADGLLELKPGCTKEETAAMFASAFGNIRLKLPPRL